MGNYDVVQAATAGLRMLWKNPKVFAAWAAFNLAVFALFLAAIALSFGDVFQALLESARSGAELSDADALGLFGRFAIGFLVMLPLYLFYISVQQAAATRAMLQPEDDRFGYLRVGAGELRMAGALVILGFVQWGIQLLFVLMGGVVGFAVLAAMGGDDGAGPIAMQIVQQLVQLPMYLVIAFVLIRLAMGRSIVLDRRTVNVFASWKLTKGGAVGILVTYVLVAVIYFAFGILAFILGLSVFAAVGLSSWGAIMQAGSDPQALFRTVGPLLLPLGVGLSVIGALLAPVFIALAYCPAAWIYRQVHMRGPEQVF